MSKYMHEDKSVGKMAITTEKGAKLILDLNTDTDSSGNRPLRIMVVGDDNGYRGLVDIYELSCGKIHVVNTLNEV